MKRRSTHHHIGIAFILFLCFAAAAWGKAHPNDYTRLIELIRVKDRSAPLLAFNRFKKDTDIENQQKFLGYLNDHPEIIDRIQDKLGEDDISWRLNKLNGRLVFVPEQRPEYASIFEAYCREAIEYLLRRTDLPNPFHAIRTLKREIPEPSKQGVTALLVHNLAKESIAEFIFSNAKQKKIRLRLKGMKFIGRIGAYSTVITQEGNGSFKFRRDRFTIWQNSAKNPYTALMTPVEETLHILLRDSTENEIQKHITRNQVRHLRQVKRIATDWIQVEEAIVGGLVYHLLPEFLKNRIHRFPDRLIEQDILSKAKQKQYKYLKKGIQAVEKLGCQESIQVYKKDPKAFKKIMLESELA